MQQRVLILMGLFKGTKVTIPRIGRQGFDDVTKSQPGVTQGPGVAAFGDILTPGFAAILLALLNRP